MNAKTLRKLPKGADLSHIHPDMHVLAVPIAALSGHPDNPRKHPDANKQAIAGSLRKYLQRKSVVVNLTPEGLRLEAGHGVYGEMLAAGSQYIACTIVEDDPVTELGFMLADNRSGDLSEDDPEKLAPILRQLIDAGEDVEEVGWDEQAVKALLKDSAPDDEDKPTPEPQVDKAGELQKEWKTELGQLWEIPSKTGKGIHRVLCGDSLDPASIDLALGGQVPDGVWSDAPYGIAFDPMKKRGLLAKSIPRPSVIGDDTIDTAVASFSMLWASFPGALHVWWGSNHYSSCFPPSSCWLVWDKENNGDFADCELAWCSDKGAVRIFRHMWNGMMKASERGERRLHATQKPVALFDWCAQKYLPGEGKVWLDPFAGSGISLLGAERLGQIACCVELSEAYVAVILERARKEGLEPRLVNV